MTHVGVVLLFFADIGFRCLRCRIPAGQVVERLVVAVADVTGPVGKVTCANEEMHGVVVSKDDMQCFPDRGVGVRIVGQSLEIFFVATDGRRGVAQGLDGRNLTRRQRYMVAIGQIGLEIWRPCRRLRHHATDRRVTMHHRTACHTGCRGASRRMGAIIILDHGIDACLQVRRQLLKTGDTARAWASERHRSVSQAFHR